LRDLYGNCNNLKNRAHIIRDGQGGEHWEHSVQATFFQISGKFGQYSVSLLFGLQAVTWSRQSVEWPLTAEDLFSTGAIHVGFVVDKVALEKLVCLVLLLSAANIVPIMFHTHLHSQSFPPLKNKLVKPGDFPTEVMLFQKSRRNKAQMYVHCCFSVFQRSTKNKLCRTVFNWFWLS
jgi:hypothetical protein